MAPTGHLRAQAVQPLHFAGSMLGLGQRFALAGRTMLVEHVRVVFLTEIAQRGQHRVRRRLAQAAERAFLHGEASFCSSSRVSAVPRPSMMSSSRASICVVPFAAQHALAAALALGEVHEEPRDAHHAGLAGS